MSLEIKNIDFDNIKLNLINFLKNQDKFAGYNFEGSSLNILIDLLSYNTYYQMFYNNMAFNEMFLDSAVKRSSVVSLAKLLGYTPGSAKSSRCNIQVSITGTSVSSDRLLIPKYTKFTTGFQGNKYDFFTLQDYYLTGSNGVYTSDSMEIVEGSLSTKTFIHDINYPFQKYVLPYTNIDISTLELTVQQSNSDTTGLSDVWYIGKDITKITESSPIYYVEENFDGFYEFSFGDGILGKKLSNNNKINTKFLLSTGELNGIGSYGSTNTFTTNIFSSNDVDSTTITVLKPSYGSSLQESIQSIKTKAPKSFTTQERAVTVDDYTSIVMKQFANIKDVSCWGGEDNTPPEYTKIFICVKPKNSEMLSDTEKENIKNILIKERGIVGIVPVLVDPELTYINTSSSIQINPSKLKIPKSALQNKIKQSIQNFISDTIDVFNGDFYVNELIPVIDALDESIKGITVRVVIEKRFYPIYTQLTDYKLDFKNPIRITTCGETIINSSLFVYPDLTGILHSCQFKNGVDNNLDIVYTDENSKVITIKTIGLVNYDMGYIDITDFQPISLIRTDQLRVYAIPKDNNIYAEKNNILTIDQYSEDVIKIDILDLPYRANM